MQSFMPTRFFVFKIQAIKNGFAGPKSFRGFRETGPWSVVGDQPLTRSRRNSGLEIDKKNIKKINKK